MTGAQYSPRVVACWDCVTQLWVWLRMRMARVPKRATADFYAAAGKRIEVADGR
jgi:hypothetical protein